MNNTMVKVSNFHKRYGNNVAVKNLSFEAAEGEIFALLGPNGSGKTSTLESLEGLRMPDGGTITVAGIDPSRHPRKLFQVIGVQLQTSALPSAMTVEEAMSFFCAYHHIRPKPELTDRLGLQEKRKAQYGKLSVGQQRKLSLALAVAHEPKVLFLDEPTAGLDVESRAELHVIIRELKEGGTTVILASHDMAEVEKLADRAAIIVKGELAGMGTPRELTAAGSRKTLISVSTEGGLLKTAGISFPEAVPYGSKDGYVSYLSDNPGKTVSAILAWLEQARDVLIDLRVERPSLEERFLELTSLNKLS